MPAFQNLSEFLFMTHKDIKKRSQHFFFFLCTDCLCDHADEQNSQDGMWMRKEKTKEDIKNVSDKRRKIFEV